jgi:hypothetical protein
MSNKDSGREIFAGPSFFPDQHIVFEVMTIDEVIIFLRIPEVSTSKDYHNVVKNLIRFRNLPHICISNKMLFPRQAVLEWVAGQTIRE